MRSRFLRAGALGVAVVAAAPAFAAELVMFTRKTCAYCALWERQIGPIYPRTEEGARAPLRKVDLDEGEAGLPDYLKGVSITPTFVLVDSGHEIARFAGYSDELTFWSLLSTVMARLPAASK